MLPAVIQSFAVTCCCCCHCRHAKLYAEVDLPHGPNFNEEDVSDKPAWLQFIPRQAWLLVLGTSVLSRQPLSERIRILSLLTYLHTWVRSQPDHPIHVQCSPDGGPMLPQPQQVLPRLGATIAE